MFHFLHKKCEARNKELATRASELEQKINSLENELENAPSLIASLSREKKELSQKLENERTDSAAKAHKLESELEAQKYEYKTLIIEKQNVEQENKATKDLCAQLETKYSTLCGKLTKMQEEFEQSKQAIKGDLEKKYQTEISELEKSYQDELENADNELKASREGFESLRQTLKKEYEKKEAALFVQVRNQLGEKFSQILKLYLDAYRTLRYRYPDKKYVNREMFEIINSIPFDKKEDFLKELKSAATTGSDEVASSDEVDEVFRKYRDARHKKEQQPNTRIQPQI